MKPQGLFVLLLLIAAPILAYTAEAFDYNVTENIIPVATQCMTGDTPNVVVLVSLDSNETLRLPLVSTLSHPGPGESVYCFMVFAYNATINTSRVRSLALMLGSERVASVSGVELYPDNVSKVAVKLRFQLIGADTGYRPGLLTDAADLVRKRERILRVNAVSVDRSENRVVVTYATPPGASVAISSDVTSETISVTGMVTPLIELRFNKSIDILVDHPIAEVVVEYTFTYNVSGVDVYADYEYDPAADSYEPMIILEIGGGTLTPRLERFSRAAYVENTVLEFTADITGAPVDAKIYYYGPDYTLYLPCQYTVVYSIGSISKVKGFCPFVWTPIATGSSSNVAIEIQAITTTATLSPSYDIRIDRVLLVSRGGVYDLGSKAKIVGTTAGVFGGSPYWAPLYPRDDASTPSVLLAALLDTYTAIYTAYIDGDPVARVELADAVEPIVHIAPEGPVAAPELPPPPLGNVSVPRLRPRVPAVTTPEGALFYSGLLSIYIWLARRMGWETAMIPIGMVIAALGAASGNGAAQLGGLLAILAGVLLLSWRRG